MNSFIIEAKLTLHERIKDYALCLDDQRTSLSEALRYTGLLRKDVKLFELLLAGLLQEERKNEQATQEPSS